MSKEDLIRSLGLDDKPEEISGEVPPGEKPQGPPPSEYALKHDGWTRRRGEELLEKSNEEGGRLVEAVCPKDDFLWAEKMKEGGKVVADLFGACFEPEPRLEEKCKDEVRHEFLKNLMETQEFAELHQSTMMNELASEIGATAFAESLARLRVKEEEPGKDPEMETLKAAGEALRGAKEEVECLEAAQEGCGMGESLAGGKMDLQRAGELYRRIRNSPLLRSVIEKAGRFRRVARSKQRQKASHGLDDMVGVELGGDLGKVLASELGRLGVEELELDVMRRMVEGQLQQRQYRGVEPVGKGPVIFVVDESGSMYGEKIEAAKALALTMAWIARQQKRWCCLVGYSGSEEGNLLVLPETGWKELDLLEWCEHFYGHGTSMDLPLKELPEKYYPSFNAPKGKVDLILVTDGICSISEKLEKDFNAWRQAEQVKAYCFMIGDYGDEEMRKVCDEVYCVPSLDPGSDAIGRVLSI